MDEWMDGYNEIQDRLGYGTECGASRHALASYMSWNFEIEEHDSPLETYEGKSQKGECFTQVRVLKYYPFR